MRVGVTTQKGAMAVANRLTLQQVQKKVTPDMREAHGKIVRLALNGMGNGMEGEPSN